MFKSLVRLRDSRPFLLTPKNEGPTWGACVSKFRKRCIATGRRKTVFLVSSQSTVLFFLRRLRLIVVTAWYHFGVSAVGCLSLDT